MNMYDPIIKYSYLGMNENVVMCLEGTPNQERLCWQRPTAISPPYRHEWTYMFKTFTKVFSFVGTEIVPPKREELAKCSKVVEGAP
jgi:hypothetical protein